MANNEPQDQERDIERLLRDHFASEGQDFRAPDDLWLRLESRLGEQRGPFQPSAIRDALFPATGRWWAPAIATAGVTAVAVAVTVTVLSTGGDESSGMQLARHSSDSGASAQYVSSEPASLPEATAAPLAEVEEPDAMMDEAVLELELKAGVSGTSITVDDAGFVAADAASASVAAANEAATAANATAVAAAEAAAQAANAAAAASGQAREAAAAAGATGASGPQGDAGARAARPSATEFQDYGRQAFVSAFDDPVSTFSLDTDRTSYHLALNWARNGYEVDPDSVRAEEWINAFDYGYQPPSSRREFAIYSDVARHPLDDRLHLARVAFQARTSGMTRP